jgi:hypothetical protein
LKNQETNTENELLLAEKHFTQLNRLIYIGITLSLVFICAYAINFYGPLSPNPEHWGQFGDFLGGVLNPTFSFLALIALLATFSLQIKELKISTKELKNSASALTKQNETLRQQKFEGSFFQLLNLHNTIVNSIDLDSAKKTTKGRDCFRVFLKRLEGEISKIKNCNEQEFKAIYSVYFIEHEPELGHYFRLLYNIIKLIKTTPDIDKKFYTNIVRAQLSSAELMLIFYNCISDFGNEKFKPLVEEFALLKTIPRTVLPNQNLLHLYRESAFGGTYPIASL